jgi:hypothetical protein
MSQSTADPREADFENPVSDKSLEVDDDGEPGGSPPATGDRESDAELSKPMLWTKMCLTWVGASPASSKCMVYFTIACLANLCVSFSFMVDEHLTARSAGRRMLIVE